MREAPAVNYGRFTCFSPAGTPMVLALLLRGFGRFHNRTMASLSWQMINLGFCAFALALLWAVEKK